MSDIENSIIEVDVVMRKDVNRGLMTTLGDISKIFYLTMVLSTALSLFLVWAIFSAIANERTREIGIMRALGAKEGHVVHVFLYEVLALGAVGSLIGILAGTGLSLAMGKSFSILKNLPVDLTSVPALRDRSRRSGIRDRNLRTGRSCSGPSFEKTRTSCS